MKKLLPFALLIALAALAAGCGRRDALPVLDLEAAMNSGRSLPGTFTLNDIFDRIDIVPIETRPDALIGTADLVHIGRGHFYLRHGNAISRIDRDGKIVNTISRQGRGPGEYLQPTHVEVNEAAGTIRVFDRQGDKYVTYDMSGNAVAEGPLADKGIGLPRFVADDYMLTFGRDDGAFRLLATDHDMNIVRGFFPMDTTLSALDRFGLTQQTGVGAAADGALVNLTTSDTLWHVNAGGMTPEAILHKGRYRRPELPIVQIYDPGGPEYLISTYVYSVGDYYIVRSMVSGWALGLWSKTDGRLLDYSHSGDGFENYGLRFVFPAGGEVRVSNFHVLGGILAFVVDAVHADIEGIAEDDNPVIVVARVK